ncbi:MAG: glycogen/starch synthase, partial [Candidatus Omnitrophota bacterium]
TVVRTLLGSELNNLRLARSKNNITLVITDALYKRLDAELRQALEDKNDNDVTKAKAELFKTMSDANKANAQKVIYRKISTVVRTLLGSELNNLRLARSKNNITLVITDALYKRLDAELRQALEDKNNNDVDKAKKELFKAMSDANKASLPGTDLLQRPYTGNASHPVLSPGTPAAPSAPAAPLAPADPSAPADPVVPAPQPAPATEAPAAPQPAPASPKAASARATTDKILKNIEEQMNSMARILTGRTNATYEDVEGLRVRMAKAKEFLAQIYTRLIAEDENFAIHPELAAIRVDENQPEPVANDRVLRIGVYPVAGNPLHWDHLLVALQAIAVEGLDKVIFDIQSGKDTRKPILGFTEGHRYELCQAEMEMFAPLFGFSENVSVDGETDIFRILSLNPKQKIDAFYIVGSDHYNRWSPKEDGAKDNMVRESDAFKAWVEKNGREPARDTIQKLEDKTDENRMGLQSPEVKHEEAKDNPYGLNKVMHSVSVIFADRPGEAQKTIEHRLKNLIQTPSVGEASATEIRKALKGMLTETDLTKLPGLVYLPYMGYEYIKNHPVYHKLLLVDAMENALAGQFNNMAKMLTGDKEADYKKVEELKVRLEKAKGFIKRICERLVSKDENERIDPYVSVRVKEEDKEIEAKDAVYRIGVYPVAGNPLHWDHLLVALQAIAVEGLDKVIFDIQSGKDTRKPILGFTEEYRYELCQAEMDMFAPFFQFSVNVSEDGETDIFRIMKLNGKQKADWFYIVGGDHFNRWAKGEAPDSMKRGSKEYEEWKAKNGRDPKPDTIQKLEDNPAKLGMDTVKHSISAIFVQRGAAKSVETSLKNLKVLPEVGLASATEIRKALKGMLTETDLTKLPGLVYLPYMGYEYIKNHPVYHKLLLVDARDDLNTDQKREEMKKIVEQGASAGTTQTTSGAQEHDGRQSADDDQMLREAGYDTSRAIAANCTFPSDQSGLSWVNGHEEYRQRLINWMKRTFGEGLKVLSLASGRGDFEVALQQAGYQVTAVEVDSQFVNESNDKGIVTYQGDARCLDDITQIQGQQYDLIVINEALGTMGLGAVKGIIKYLKDGGRVFIGEYAKNVPTGNAPVQRFDVETIESRLIRNCFVEVRNKQDADTEPMVWVYGTKQATGLERGSSQPAASQGEREPAPADASPEKKTGEDVARLLEQDGARVNAEVKGSDNLVKASLDLEIAYTSGRLGEGLGGRPGLGENQGMLFNLHGTSQTFDMHGMQFDIDILWLDETFKILHIISGASKNAPEKPLTNDSGARAAFVLEVNAGYVNRHRIQKDDRLEILGTIESAPGSRAAPETEAPAAPETEAPAAPQGLLPPESTTPILPPPQLPPTPPLPHGVIVTAVEGAKEASAKVRVRLANRRTGEVKIERVDWSRGAGKEIPTAPIRQAIAKAFNEQSREDKLAWFGDNDVMTFELRFHGNAGYIAYVENGVIYISYRAIRAPPAGKDTRHKTQDTSKKYIENLAKYFSLILFEEVGHLLRPDQEKQVHEKVKELLRKDSARRQAIENVLIANSEDMTAQDWLVSALAEIHGPLSHPLRLNHGDVIILSDNGTPRFFRISGREISPQTWLAGRGDIIIMPEKNSKEITTYSGSMMGEMIYHRWFIDTRAGVAVYRSYKFSDEVEAERIAHEGAGLLLRNIGYKGILASVAGKAKVLNSPHQKAGEIPTFLTRNYRWASDAYFPSSLDKKTPYGRYVFVIFTTEDMRIVPMFRDEQVADPYFVGKDMQEYSTFSPLAFKNALLVKNEEEYRRLVQANAKTREEGLRILGRTEEEQKAFERQVAGEALSVLSRYRRNGKRVEGVTAGGYIGEATYSPDGREVTLRAVANRADWTRARRVILHSNMTGIWEDYSEPLTFVEEKNGWTLYRITVPVGSGFEFTFRFEDVVGEPEWAYLRNGNGRVKAQEASNVSSIRNRREDPSARTRPDQTTPTAEEFAAAFSGVDLSAFDVVAQTAINEGADALDTIGEHQAARLLQEISANQHVRAPPQEMLDANPLLAEIFRRVSGVVYIGDKNEPWILIAPDVLTNTSELKLTLVHEAVEANLRVKKDAKSGEYVLGLSAEEAHRRAVEVEGALKIRVVTQEIINLRNRFLPENIRAEIQKFLGQAAIDKLEKLIAERFEAICAKEKELKDLEDARQTGTAIYKQKEKELKTLMAPIEAIINEANVQNISADLAGLDAAKVFSIDDREPADRSQAIDSLLKGEWFIQKAAGGAATRMQKSLKALGIKLTDKDYRLWNLDIWQIALKMKEWADAQDLENVKDESLRKKILEYRAIEVPAYARHLSLGERHLAGLRDGVSALKQRCNLSDEVVEQVRAKLKVVIQVNDDIQGDVEEALIKNNFFGFEPENILFIKGGYGPVFIVKKLMNAVKLLVNSLIYDTWNHGFAFLSFAWSQPYTLDKLGNRHYSAVSLFEHLKESGVKYGLTQRVNDLIALYPEQAMDVDIIDAFLTLRETQGCNVYYEMMKNPASQKGGLGLTRDPTKTLMLLVEGLTAKTKAADEKVTELNTKTGGIPYNRLYGCFEIQAVLDAITRTPIPMSIKYKNGTVSPEIPTGDITYLPGIRALAGVRKNDVLIDKGILLNELVEVEDPADPSKKIKIDAYDVGGGAVIHDCKEEKNMQNAIRMADWLDREAKQVSVENKSEKSTFPVEAQAVPGVAADWEAGIKVKVGFDADGRAQVQLFVPADVANDPNLKALDRTKLEEAIAYAFNQQSEADKLDWFEKTSGEFTLLLHGRKGPIAHTPEEKQNEVEASLRIFNLSQQALETIFFDEAGHLLNPQQTEAVHKTLIEFLAARPEHRKAVQEMLEQDAALTACPWFAGRFQEGNFEECSIQNMGGMQVTEFEYQALDRAVSGREVVFAFGQPFELYVNEDGVAYDFSRYAQTKEMVDLLNRGNEKKGDPHRYQFRPFDGIPVKCFAKEHSALFAINGHQGNFWEAHTMVIRDGKLITKTAPGIRQKTVRQINDTYSFFVIDGPMVGIREFCIENSSAKEEDICEIRVAVAGVVLVRDGKDMSDGIAGKVPAFAPNEVSWDPAVTTAAFSMVGKDHSGRVSFITVKGDGRTKEAMVKDMAWIAIRRGWIEAVLLGGSADAQQHVEGMEDIIGGLRVGTGAADTTPDGRRLATIIYVWNEDSKVAQNRDLKTIVRYLAQKDINSLTRDDLKKRFGIEQADLLILLGNSHLIVAEAAGEALKAGVAKEMMLVGGVGHSTKFLAENVTRAHNDIETQVCDESGNARFDATGKPVYRAEADILADVLQRQGVTVRKELIENHSANCSLNAKYALDILKQLVAQGRLDKLPRTVILMQDPLMQARTDASFRFEWQGEEGVRFINYAAFIPEIDMSERFLGVVMGEISRLWDSPENKDSSYGPVSGKVSRTWPGTPGWIARVDVPPEVVAAYKRLLPVFGKEKDRRDFTASHFSGNFGEQRSIPQNNAGTNTFPVEADAVPGAGAEATITLAEYQKRVAERHDFVVHPTIDRMEKAQQVVKTNHTKFLADGTMNSYYGTTVIAFVLQDAPAYNCLSVLQERIKEALEKEGLARFMHFLSAAQRHMTICDIEESSQPLTDEQIRLRIKQVKEMFVQVNWRKGIIRAEVKQLGFKGALTVLVHFRDQDQLDKAAKIESLVKNATGQDKRKFAGHISLAYRVGDATIDDLRRISEIIRQFGEEDLGLISFSEVSLTYFTDMNTFMPLVTLDLQTGAVTERELDMRSAPGVSSPVEADAVPGVAADRGQVKVELGKERPVLKEADTTDNDVRVSTKLAPPGQAPVTDEEVEQTLKEISARDDVIFEKLSEKKFRRGLDAIRKKGMDKAAKLFERLYKNNQVCIAPGYGAFAKIKGLIYFEGREIKEGNARIFFRLEDYFYQETIVHEAVEVYLRLKGYSKEAAHKVAELAELMGSQREGIRNVFSFSEELDRSYAETLNDLVIFIVYMLNADEMMSDAKPAQHYRWDIPKGFFGSNRPVQVIVEDDGRVVAEYHMGWTDHGRVGKVLEEYGVDHPEKVGRACRMDEPGIEDYFINPARAIASLRGSMANGKESPDGYIRLDPPTNKEVAEILGDLAQDGRAYEDTLRGQTINTVRMLIAAGVNPQKRLALFGEIKEAFLLVGIDIPGVITLGDFDALVSKRLADELPSARTRPGETTPTEDAGGNTFPVSAEAVPGVAADWEAGIKVKVGFDADGRAKVQLFVPADVANDPNLKALDRTKLEEAIAYAFNQQSEADKLDWFEKTSGEFTLLLHGRKGPIAHTPEEKQNEVEASLRIFNLSQQALETIFFDEVGHLLNPQQTEAVHKTLIEFLKTHPAHRKAVQEMLEQDSTLTAQPWFRTELERLGREAQAGPARRLADCSFNELQALYSDFEEGNVIVPHTLRVVQYVELIARELGLENELIDLLKRVVMVHDLGGNREEGAKANALIQQYRALIQQNGLPFKVAREDSLKALDEFLEARPDLREYRIPEADYYHISLAQVLTEALRLKGQVLSRKEVEQIYREISHERYSVDLLEEKGIRLTPAERFLIVNHFYYPKDFKGLEEVAQSSGLTVEEMKLVLDILIFCDVFENGNNASKLFHWRAIKYQPLEKTFGFFERSYGDKGLSKAPQEAMMRLLARRDASVLAIIRDGRPADSTDALKPEELKWADSQAYPNFDILTDAQGNRLAVQVKQGQTGTFNEPGLPISFEARRVDAGNSFGYVGEEFEHVVVVNEGEVSVTVDGKEFIVQQHGVIALYQSYAVQAVAPSLVTILEDEGDQSINREDAVLAEKLKLTDKVNVVRSAEGKLCALIVPCADWAFDPMKPIHHPSHPIGIGLKTPAQTEAPEGEQLHVEAPADAENWDKANPASRPLMDFFMLQEGEAEVVVANRDGQDRTVVTLPAGDMFLSLAAHRFRHPATARNRAVIISEGPFNSNKKLLEGPQARLREIQERMAQARSEGKSAVCFVAMERPLYNTKGKRLTEVGGQGGGQGMYMKDVPWAVNKDEMVSFVVKPLFSADVKKDYGTLGKFLAAFDGTVLMDIEVPVGTGSLPLKVIYVEQEGVPTLLLYDASGNIFLELYAYSDTVAGYLEAILLPRAALMIQDKLGIQFDVYHFNDWQTALGPIFLQEFYRDRHWPLGRRPAALFTTHNLEYQGLFPGTLRIAHSDSLIRYLLDRKVLSIHRHWEDAERNAYDAQDSSALEVELFKLTQLRPAIRDGHNNDGMEFWSRFEGGVIPGRHNLMKGAFLYADRIVFVSQAHMEEALTLKRGYGLDGVLTEIKDKLDYVYNGIRRELNAPENLAALKQEGFVSPVGTDRLAWKDQNKLALQKKLGLDVNRNHIILGIVTRIVKQKGLNVLFTPIHANGPTLLEAILRIRNPSNDGKVQVVVLGTAGDLRGRKVVEQLNELASREEFKGQFVFVNKFDAVLAKQIGAGSLIGLMPSIDEPGGIANQELALLLSILIVTARGGLVDFYNMGGTIAKPVPGFEIDADPASFAERMRSARIILKEIRTLFNAYSRRPQTISRYLDKIARFNPEWGERVKEYIRLYKKAVAGDELAFKEALEEAAQATSTFLQMVSSDVLYFSCRISSYLFYRFLQQAGFAPEYKIRENEKGQFIHAWVEVKGYSVDFSPKANIQRLVERGVAKQEVIELNDRYLGQDILVLGMSTEAYAKIYTEAQGIDPRKYFLDMDLIDSALARTQRRVERRTEEAGATAQVTMPGIISILTRAKRRLTGLLLFLGIFLGISSPVLAQDFSGCINASHVGTLGLVLGAVFMVAMLALAIKVLMGKPLSPDMSPDNPSVSKAEERKDAPLSFLAQMADRSMRLVPQTPEELIRSGVALDLRKKSDLDELRALAEKIGEFSSDESSGERFKKEIERLAGKRKTSVRLKIAHRMVLAREKMLALDKKRQGKIFVEVVLAVYNDCKYRMMRPEEHPEGENALREKIRQLEDLFAGLEHFDWRLRIVDDGSKTSADKYALSILAAEYPEYLKEGRIVVESLREAIDENLAKSEENRNPVLSGMKSPADSVKGGSVNYGMYQAAARGSDIVVFTDSDNSSLLYFIGDIVWHLIEENYDAAVGSRARKNSIVLNRGLTRLIQSWQDTILFNIFAIRPLMPEIREIRDTQNGFKGFWSDTLLEILPKTRIRGAIFDVELIYLSKVLGRRRGVKEFGMPWIDNPGVSNFKIRDGLRMRRELKQKAMSIRKEKVRSTSRASTTLCMIDPLGAIVAFAVLVVILIVGKILSPVIRGLIARSWDKMVTSTEFSRDIRLRLIKKLQAVLGSRYRFYPGGFASLDISMDFDKEDSVSDVFAENPGVDTVIYFGDEFFKTPEKIGNDTPLLEAQRKTAGEGRRIIIFSVDKDPAGRTDEAKENTIWVGQGPEATQRVLETILAAIEGEEERVIIKGQGMDAAKSVAINLSELLERTFLLFDIDGTLLTQKGDNFSNQPAIRDIFARMLQDNLRVGIISGNSRAEQIHRVGLPVRQAVDDADRMRRFVLYVNGGTTRVTFDQEGRDTAKNLAEEIPWQDIEKIREVLAEEAGKNFGLNAFEVAAWRCWFDIEGQRLGRRPGFENILFKFWERSQRFIPTVVEDSDIKEAGGRDMDPLVLSEPFIEVRDNVQVSIKLLPKRVEISYRGAMGVIFAFLINKTKKATDLLNRIFTKYISRVFSLFRRTTLVSERQALEKRLKELMGVGDLVENQRLRDKRQAKENADAALGYILRRLRQAGLPTDASLTREDFNRLFGVRPVIMAAGYASRFSRFIHKALATSGMKRNNLMLALQGSYSTPGVRPVIVIGDKILGLILKDEFITGYQEATFSFLFDQSIIAPITQNHYDPEHFLDDAKVRKYFGRSQGELIFIFCPQKGHGDALMCAQQRIAMLPREEQVPFIQVIFGEMATAMDKNLSNASFITYLKIISGDYLAVSGGKEAERNVETGLYQESSVRGKGCFFKIDGRLVCYTDWDLIPHKVDMNQDDPSKRGWDRVYADWAKLQEELEETLSSLPEDDQARRRAVLRILEDPRYHYFIVSGEGELFCQENILACLEEVNRWDTLSKERKAYLMRHYAIVDHGDFAVMLISSNTGIFRNDALGRALPYIQGTYVADGYQAYEENRSEDIRRAGLFWGVDGKNGETKTLAWNLVRLIGMQFKEENPNQVIPIALVDVAEAPTSIKDSMGQIHFMEYYQETYFLGARMPRAREPIDLIAMRVVESLRKKDAQAAAREIFTAPKSISQYRKIIKSLFIALSQDAAQGVFLEALALIEGHLRGIIAHGEEYGVIPRAPPVVLLGVILQSIAEAIDEGLVANNLDALTSDRRYIKSILDLRKRILTSTKSGLSDYLLTRLGHIIIQTLESQIGTRTLTSLVPERRMFASSPKKSKRQIVLLTGGTAIGAFYRDALEQAGLLEDSEIFGVVGNYDDGGSSHIIVTNLNRAGHGLIPPPGDQIGSVRGFTTQDKNAHILGDGGRIDKFAQERTFFEAVLPFVLRTLADPSLDIQEDFFYFARVLMTAMRRVDRVNEGKARDEYVLPIGGASIRNLLLLGFLAEEGFFDKPSDKKIGHSAVAGEEEQARYRAAMRSLTRTLGVDNFEIMVSSFDPKTLYARTREYTLLIRDKERIHSVVFGVHQGMVEVVLPSSYGRTGSRRRILRNGEEVSLSDMGMNHGFGGKDIRLANRGGRVSLILGVRSKEWIIREDDRGNGTILT